MEMTILKMHVLFSAPWIQLHLYNLVIIMINKLVIIVIDSISLCHVLHMKDGNQV